MSHNGKICYVMTYVDFKLNVALKELFFRTHPNSRSKKFTGCRKVQSPHLKLGKHQPDFCEGELLMRYNL